MTVRAYANPSSEKELGQIAVEVGTMTIEEVVVSIADEARLPEAALKLGFIAYAVGRTGKGEATGSQSCTDTVMYCDARHACVSSGEADVISCEAGWSVLFETVDEWASICDR